MGPKKLVGAEVLDGPEVLARGEGVGWGKR
jgi:hypothetical protein